MAIQALILAAGRGSRLGPNSEGVPKPLLEVGRRPLVSHMIQTLSDAGVGPVALVVGYCADEIREVVGIRAEYINNPRWATTNSLYSFALARSWVRGPVMILNCDLIVHPEIIDRLLEAGEDSIAYDSSSGAGREQMVAKFRDGLLADMSKDLKPEEGDGENVGVLYFSQQTAQALFGQADELVAQGQEKSWIGSAVREVCRRREIRGVDVAGLPWAEIDFANDLENARKSVWPEIDGSRRARRLGRLARWGLAASLLVLATPVMIRGLMPPVAPDWDTTDLTGAPLVQLMRDETRTQRWWALDRDGAVAAEVAGPQTVRIETRLLLEEPAEQPVPYVIEVQLDGESVDWFKLDTLPSGSASYEGRIVGKRRRTEFEVPAGVHRLSARLVPADGRSCLVRFRQLDPTTD